MKKIFLVIYMFTLIDGYAQDTLKSSTTFSFASRAYAPATGSVLNEHSVFEMTQVFSIKKHVLVLIKSVDFKDSKSLGNYSMLSYEYALNKSFWVGGALAEFESDFLPTGTPFIFIQGGFREKRKSSLLSVRGTFISKIGSPNTYVIKPTYTFIAKNNSNLSQHLWISNNNITLGTSYLSQGIKCGDNSISVFVDWNLRILNLQPSGIFRSGLSLSILN